MFSAELERQHQLQRGSSYTSETPLQNSFAFWYIGKTGPTENYEDSIKKIGSFKTVEGFWQIYNHLKRPSDLEEGVADYQLFREGIKPTWEDPNNSKGGKWVFKTPSQLTSALWEELVLAIIGEQFEDKDEICGAVVSVRHNGDIISLWHKTAEDTEASQRISEHIRALWKVPYYVTVDYKAHNTSLLSKPVTVWRSQRVAQLQGGRAPPPPPPEASSHTRHERSTSASSAGERGQGEGGGFGRDRSRDGEGGGGGAWYGGGGGSGDWHHKGSVGGRDSTWGKGRDDWRTAGGRERGERNYLERSNSGGGGDRGFGDRGFGGSPPEHQPKAWGNEPPSEKREGGGEEDGWEVVKKGGRSEGHWR